MAQRTYPIEGRSQSLKLASKIQAFRNRYIWLGSTGVRLASSGQASTYLGQFEINFSQSPILWGVKHKCQEGKLGSKWIYLDKTVLAFESTEISQVCNQ